MRIDLLEQFIFKLTIWETYNKLNNKLIIIFMTYKKENIVLIICQAAWRSFMRDKVSIWSNSLEKKQVRLCKIVVYLVLVRHRRVPR